MSNTYTRADALRLYLTGAATNGGYQSDSDLALGHYRSSVEAEFLGVAADGLAANLTIEYASGGNGTGTGALACTGDNTLTWTPPGGTVGPAVTIASGETKIIEGENPDQFLRVTRTSAVALTGTASVTLTDVFNNVVGMDNVAGGEALTGATALRALCLRNLSGSDVLSVRAALGTLATQRVSGAVQLAASGAGAIQLTTGNFDDWPDTGWCLVRTAGGAVREAVYYTARTSTELTVPAAGRGLLGTSATAGEATDTLDAIPGYRVAFEFGQVSEPVFSGTGLDDLSAEAEYRLATDTSVTVEIDAAATPDMFRWSLDGGLTWVAEDVPVTGSAQTLQDGIAVAFGATTGHTVGDRWTFTATATAQDKRTAGDASVPSGLTWSVAASLADGPDAGTLGAGEQVFLWLRREVPAGCVATPQALAKVAVAFDSV